MQRYSAYGPTDDPAIVDGDGGFSGVDQYTSPENLEPEMAQDAVNMDFSTRDAVTRGGFVCIPSLGNAPFDASATWVSRASTNDYQWNSVAYGNGVFVAVASTGAGGRVMTSSDGITWISRSASAASAWQSVTFGNGLFVAVAYSGTEVMTSVDGITWTSRTGTGTGTWSGIAYGDGLFVAVAANKGVMTSPDGVTWTARTATTDIDQIQSVTYGDGLFVAVGQSTSGSPIMTSPDGITWTASSSVPGSTYFLNSVAFGRGHFVAVVTDGASAYAAWSSDSTATAAWYYYALPSASWNSVCFGNGLFVAVGQNGTGTQLVVTSPDGITWTTRNAATTNFWKAVTYGSSKFVAVSTTGTGDRVMTASSNTAVWATGIYSDPNDAGSQWVMLVGSSSVGFYAFGKTTRTVTYSGGQTVSQLSTVVQANNKVYIFRGSGSTPLVWDGSWANTFTVATGSIPSSNMAIYSQNRLWAIVGKDSFFASDVLDFTAWTEITSQFNLSTGDSNYLVTAFPFGDSTLIVFKNRSVLALQGVDGALTDVVATEITRQVGAVGINAVVSVGPDLVYMSDRNINLLSLTQTNNAVQHKTLPLSTPIKKILDRVNWEYGYKVSMGYWDNRLYVALPLDNATSCSTVVVYNFVTGKWYGEWNFDDSLAMSILGWETAEYLGLQRLHAITEDGRIFVVGEGWQDISGTSVFEISTSLTTRAYRADGDNRVNRRMWVDLSTWRPNFSVTGYVDGISEFSRILIEQTFVRTMSWIFGDSYYNPTNANDDYNREGRKDYAGYPGDNIQAQSGFLPEAMQEYRLPILFRRKGRLVWYKITNTQGKITVSGIGGEARAGDRSSYTQVI